MVELKLQRPFIDENGNVREKLEKHYAEDENGVKYKIKQVETGRVYNNGEAVDLVPCRYTYQVLNEIIEEVANESRDK